MKFKDLKNVLSCTDTFEIFTHSITIVCDNDNLEDEAETFGLDEMEVCFIRAHDENSMYIRLKDKRG